MHGRWSTELAEHWPALEKVVADALGRSREPIPRDARLLAAGHALDTTIDRLLETNACVTPETLLAHTLVLADGTWSGADAENLIAQRIDTGIYTPYGGRSLTTPAREERLRESVLKAHAAGRLSDALPVRGPGIGLGHALQLAIARSALVFGVTNSHTAISFPRLVP